MTRLSLALIAALLVAPFGAMAQPPAPSPAPAPVVPPDARPWQVDWGQYYCSLIRHAGEGRPYAAAFLSVPGSERTSLVLVPENRAPLPRGVTTVVLLPSGRSIDVYADEEWRGRVRTLQIGGLPYELRGDLEGATELQLRAGAEVRLRIPLDRSRAAVVAHRRCTAEISREWGLDEARLAALRTRPTSTNLLGYNAADYPAAALRTATQGRVIMRITVTADARPQDCAVVATSGNADIDAVSCRVAMRDGRYRAGIDAAGQPVTIASVFTVTWRLPNQ